ncbi:MAG: hypothetical protein HUJ31_16355 [Pseudomonadales bacterium]|nr:hypothetical protein [Pseudomonadales bacterium]
MLGACVDDPVVKSLLPRVKRSVMTYGFDDDADVQAYDLVQKGAVSHFSVRRKNHADDLKVTLAFPGRHNVLNALAAIAIASDEGATDEDIVAGLAAFEGVGRRFEIHGTFYLENTGATGAGQFTLVDDYGHHPSEVKATIESVREGWPDSRLVMVYQPHRYTRTLELFDQFVEVLSQVDRLILLDVYPAGEDLIVGATGQDLYKALARNRNLEMDFLESVDDVPAKLEEILQADDLVLTQGAGETSKLARGLKEMWANRRVA